MKKYRIRKWSVAWWAATAVKAGVFSVIYLAIMIGALALYSMRAGLPMPWEMA